MYVETLELTKRYRRLTALSACSLRVDEGEVFGLLGPNGAGKTTLIRLLMGLLRPSAGRAVIDDLDCYRQTLRVRQRVAYLPGEARLFPQMRGSDVLEFFATVRPHSDKQRFFQLAERLELDLTRRVGFMSTGMRQKLALAATLGSQTPLVILDEPTSNLDPNVRAAVMHMVREAKQRGSTVLFSSHVLSEVEEVCDRAAILRAGRLVHTQVLAELRRRHRIHALLSGELPPVPPQFGEQVAIQHDHAGDVTIETSAALAPLLGWFATLPLVEMRIEPVGLRTVYERFHPRPTSSLPAGTGP